MGVEIRSCLRNSKPRQIANKTNINFIQQPSIDKCTIIEAQKKIRIPGTGYNRQIDIDRACETDLRVQDVSLPIYFPGLIGYSDVKDEDCE